jgi:hypothetical protein
MVSLRLIFTTPTDRCEQDDQTDDQKDEQSANKRSVRSVFPCGSTVVFTDGVRTFRHFGQIGTEMV